MIIFADRFNGLLQKIFSIHSARLSSLLTLSRSGSIYLAFVSAVAHEMCYAQMFQSLGEEGGDRAIFEEVSTEVFPFYSGPSSGVAVGDINGDGWPDIFDTHHGAVPSLYLNTGSGTYVEAEHLLPDGLGGDQHGAAWADFDNDGDDDLLILGGGGGGKGRGSKSVLLVNVDSQLKPRTAFADKEEQPGEAARHYG